MKTLNKGFKTMTVFTMAYFPFVMGGETWQPVGIRTKAAGPYDLGKGFTGWLVIAPNGRTFVAEELSGAFVGGSVELVRGDVADGEQAMMQRQVDEGIELRKRVKMIEPDEFWRKLKCQTT